MMRHRESPPETKPGGPDSEDMHPGYCLYLQPGADPKCGRRDADAQGRQQENSHADSATCGRGGSLRGHPRAAPRQAGAEHPADPRPPASTRSAPRQGPGATPGPNLPRQTPGRPGLKCMTLHDGLRIPIRGPERKGEPREPRGSKPREI